MLFYTSLGVSAVISGPVCIFAGVYFLMSVEALCLSPAVEGVDYLYFSFTTFTTLGYGDISPVGHCRLVSSLEAVSGIISFGFTIAGIQLAVRELERRRA